ncbi:MAG: VCBS repeat-containing protein [Planctomycetota bacterium]
MRLLAWSCHAALGVLFVSLAVPRFAAAGILIGNGVYSVDVGEKGVLIGVPLPGLHTIDGRQVNLVGACVEWFGIAFRDASGLVEASGSGRVPDWAGRPPVDLVWAGGTWDEATCVTRAGPLAITTRYHFDPRRPFLLVAVTLENLGTEVLREVRYTRSWRVAGVDEPPLPPGIVQREWRFDDLRPGATTGAGLSFAPDDSAAAVFDVPLEYWTNADFPAGLPIGATNGIAWGDYDADGYPDLFACMAANLWRNLAGQSWALAVNLNGVLPPVVIRYSASFGDYDQSGLPDIGTEPRRVMMADSCFHLLENQGNAAFVDVATDPSIVIGQPCGADAETLCWADVDGDGELDAFLPTYPPWAIFPGPGNFFLHNLGPVGPADEHVLIESVAEVGLKNPPPDTARPEGAQFCDVDQDGDLDLYANGTLYQNRSRLRVPRFAAMTEAGSGIGFRTQLDEGAAFFDYDLDGDDDLAIAYVAGTIGVQIWENRGDGTFFLAERSLIESPYIGLGIGLSVADWDNDGDLDFTTRSVFRRNLLRETGAPAFTLAYGQIPGEHLQNATPAWADWDRDGDLDCALGNWLKNGTFYENTLYAGVPLAERAFVRVRPVRAAAQAPLGLETEYGTAVALQVWGERLPRRQFTASSSGMLNQNEYDLTFGLTGAPAAGGLAASIRFDLASTFPLVPGGRLWRVDPVVNPVLGGLELGTLQDREIVIERGGGVRMQSCAFAPAQPMAPVVLASAGGLMRPEPATAMLPPAAAAQPSYFVGLDFDTLHATTRLRVVGLEIDGQLDAAVDCGGVLANVLLWDVTQAGAPQLARHGRLALATSPRNHRSHLPVALTLEPDRSYRLVARVTRYRFTTIAGPLALEPVHVRGGLAFRDAAPCTGAAAASAPVLAQRMPLALCYHREAPPPWRDLGNGLPGTSGVPVLSGSGDTITDAPIQLVLGGARAHAPAYLVIGTGAGCQPHHGGRLIPLPEFVLDDFVTDENGEITYDGTWPEMAAAASIFFQFWVQDPGGPEGYAASNAVCGTTY